MKILLTVITVVLLSTLSFAGNITLTKATPQQVNTYSILKNYLGNVVKLNFTCGSVYHIKMRATKEDADITYAAIDNLRLARGFNTLIDEGVVDDSTGGSGLYVVIFGGQPDRFAIVFGYSSKDNKTITYLYGECFYARK